MDRICFHGAAGQESAVMNCCVLTKVLYLFQLSAALMFIHATVYMTEGNPQIIYF